MSTRATIFYTDDIHIYDELNDDYIHLEYFKDGFEVNCILMKSDEMPKELRDFLRKSSEPYKK